MNHRLTLLIHPPGMPVSPLSRVLAEHPAIAWADSPHILTPLAYLGYYDKVYKAPYDHVLAAESQRLFVERLPGKEQDYIRACRAYCDTLYERAIGNSGKTVILDDSLEDPRVLLFAARILPDASYILLVRHPLALFVDAESRAKDYLKAVLGLVGNPQLRTLLVPWESLAANPEQEVAPIIKFLGLPAPAETGFGDRGSGLRLEGESSWAQALASDRGKIEAARKFIAQFTRNELALLGYPEEDVWKPLEERADLRVTTDEFLRLRYRSREKALRLLRRAAAKGPFRKALKTAQLACDVFLRE
ncbi:MAG: hypothetical protein HY706_13260 [Candidatus Hydrogenedentes bacterium]|nr:hypothetical protein [Candidatus Hydrogenedentota bacterium]